ncbi:MAG: hypothetical protein ACW99Q_22365, partial [Candidatus Kariarchaeaceae archaeon]
MTEVPKDVDLPEFIKEDYLVMSDGTELRRLYYHPENPKGNILMYPGMNTLVLSWIQILEGLHEANFRVDYIESREKYTAKLLKNYDISRERMLLDCVESINLSGLTDQKYTAIGSSLGSTTLIHCLSDKTIKPTNVILVGPAVVFKMPTAFKLLMPFTSTWTYNNI